MPNATMLARPLSEATPHPDADVTALAAGFEAAYKQEGEISRDDAKTDEELDAALDRTRQFADEILSLSGTNLAILRLKAKVYLWAESETVKSLSQRATVTADEALVSLFRDLGVDRALDSVRGGADDPQSRLQRRGSLGSLARTERTLRAA
jgi:hypothetical protein